MNDKCTWQQDEPDSDSWETDCGNYFTIIEGTPIENNFKFCPYCGKEIEQNEVDE